MHYLTFQRLYLLNMKYSFLPFGFHFVISKKFSSKTLCFWLQASVYNFLTWRELKCLERNGERPVCER